ncbi:MAG: hypothetical protein ACI4T6_06680 [Candidatus Flemingiibacterium sp.]
MKEKAMSVTKAALAGAVFGSAVGMFSAPKSKKKHDVRKDVTGTLGIIGTAMKDISALLSKK